MNRIFLAPAVLAALAPFAAAQFEGENRYSPSDVSALVDRVHDDLNHAYGCGIFRIPIAIV